MLPPRTTATSADSPRTMALTMGALYFAGAAIGALTLILPHPVSYDDAGLWSNVALAAISAMPLVAFAGRFPVWSLQIAIALGTLVVTRAVYLGNDAGSFYSFWYVWVGLYVFFFFGRRWGAVHMLWMGIAYGWALTQIPATSPIARWVMTIGTIAIAGVLIDTLARRMRRRAAEADKRARSLAAVSDTAHELARHTSSKGAALVVCEAATRSAEAQAAALWVPTSGGTGLVAAASTDSTLADRQVAFVGSPVGAVKSFSSGETGITLGRDDPALPPLSEYEAGSAYFQPVVHDGVPMGVLAVYWARPRLALDDDTEQVISLLGAESAIAIERASMLARLERVARTDDLTGLANRRAWDEHLVRELARAERTGLAAGAGDPRPRSLQGLQRPARPPGGRPGAEGGRRGSLGRLLRETDILARYGGEEFALALPGADAEEAAGDGRAPARGDADGPDGLRRGGALGPRRVRRPSWSPAPTRPSTRPSAAARPHGHRLRLAWPYVLGGSDNRSSFRSPKPTA